MILERPNVHAEGRARALARIHSAPVPVSKTAIGLMSIGRDAGYADGRFLTTHDPEIRELDNVLAGKRAGGIFAGFTCRPDRPRQARPVFDPLGDVTAAELRAHYRATRARLVGRSSCRAAAGEPEERVRVPVPSPSPPEFPRFGSPQPIPAPPRPRKPARPTLVYAFLALVGPHRPSKRIRGIPTRVSDVIVEVADRHAVPIGVMRSNARTREFVHARQEAMFLLKTRFNLSLPAIGRYLGGRDHTTVLHGVRRHAERLARAGSW